MKKLKLIKTACLKFRNTVLLNAKLMASVLMQIFIPHFWYFITIIITITLDRNWITVLFVKSIYVTLKWHNLNFFHVQTHSLIFANCFVWKFHSAKLNKPLILFRHISVWWMHESLIHFWMSRLYIECNFAIHTELCTYYLHLRSNKFCTLQL